MKAVAILSFLLSIVAFLHHDNSKIVEDSLADVVATKYLVYRSAALKHVLTSGVQAGEIETRTVDNQLYIGSVPLINNFRFINNRVWHTYVQNGVCYIYGALSPKEMNLVKDKLLNSYLVGFVHNGFLVNDLGGGKIAIPDHVTQTQIPAGRYLFVSVTNVH